MSKTLQFLFQAKSVEEKERLGKWLVDSDFQAETISSTVDAPQAVTFTVENAEEEAKLNRFLSTGDFEYQYNGRPENTDGPASEPAAETGNDPALTPDSVTADQAAAPGGGDTVATEPVVPSPAPEQGNEVSDEQADAVKKRIQ